jgi:hypothetical protein
MIRIPVDERAESLKRDGIREKSGKGKKKKRRGGEIEGV